MLPALIRRHPPVAVGGCIAAAVFAYWLVVLVQVWRQANRDEAAPADAIVVFGAAEYRGQPSPVLRARLDHALALYRRGFAPRIITTGGHGGDPVFTEGEVSRSYLARQDVPAEAILVESEGDSTMESAAAVGEIMDRMRMSSCIVVSDGYHIYRVKKMLEARGIRVLGSPRLPGSDPPLRRAWHYARQAFGYILWKAGIRV
jgi:uncharacterized SAM-binding protein YcdF (DUF218 family)